MIRLRLAGPPELVAGLGAEIAADWGEFRSPGAAPRFAIHVRFRRPDAPLPARPRGAIRQPWLLLPRGSAAWQAGPVRGVERADGTSLLIWNSRRDPALVRALVRARDVAGARAVLRALLGHAHGLRADLAGFHRLHAVGWAVADAPAGERARLAALPPGGGKSTLARLSWLASDPRVRLLSDESPLLRRRPDGRIEVHPWPQALAPREGEANSGKLRHPFPAATTAPARLARVHWAARRSSASRAPAAPRATPLSRARLILELLAGVVLGAGTVQMREFWLRPGMAGALRRALRSRARLAAAIYRDDSIRHFELERGADPALTLTLLLPRSDSGPAAPRPDAASAPMRAPATADRADAPASP